MPKSKEDLQLDAERGAVLAIANEAKKSNLPWVFFKGVLLRAIGTQADLIERQVSSNGYNTSAAKKLERLATRLTFSDKESVSAAIDEYLNEK